MRRHNRAEKLVRRRQRQSSGAVLNLMLGTGCVVGSRLWMERDPGLAWLFSLSGMLNVAAGAHALGQLAGVPIELAQ